MEAIPDKLFKTVSAVDDGLFRAPSHMACSLGPVPFRHFSKFSGTSFLCFFYFLGGFHPLSTVFVKTHRPAKVETACLLSSSWQVKLPTVVSRVENEVFNFVCCNHVD